MIGGTINLRFSEENVQIEELDIRHAKLDTNTIPFIQHTKC